MKQINVKKLLLPNLPYVFIALFATKLGQAARLAPGADFSAKALHIMEGFAAAFQSALPSFHPIDLCVGIAAALLIRLAVYVKGKNARKFRKNIEYGSARWGNAEDIKPYLYAGHRRRRKSARCRLALCGTGRRHGMDRRKSAEGRTIPGADEAPL